MQRLMILAAAALLGMSETSHAQHIHEHLASEAFTATPAFAPDGTLWLARGTADQVLVVRSSDLGKTFLPATATTAGPIDVDWGPDSRPQIVIGRDGALLVSWAIFQDKRFNGRVYWSRSTDNGATFSAPQPITADATSQRFHVMAIDPDGRPFAAWLDKRNVAPARAAGKHYDGAALAYAWLDDNKRFADTHIAFDDTCECCRLTLAFAGAGRPAVMFRNIFPGSIRDHAVVTFKDPMTPGPLRRVSVDDWKIEACPHHGPSLAIASDGSYHAAWFTDGAKRKGLFYARADSADAPFGAPRPLASPDRHPARPYLLAVGKAVHLVWKEFDGDKTRVMGQASNDYGRSWSAPRAIAETADASDHPILVAYKAHAYLSWLTKAEGYRLISLEEGS